MLLGSEKIDDKRIYIFELSEKEYVCLMDGQTITKHVEWSEGRGRFELKFIKHSS